MSDARLSGGHRKRVYRMGDVCRITGLEDHVLRYWETEFPQLTPRKSRGGHRLYEPEDVDLVLHIQDLLHVQGYTIAGARRRLDAEGMDGSPEDDSAAALLDTVRAELRAILTLLEADDKL